MESKKTQTIRLTDSIFHALLNMTGGDVDLHMPKKRALVRRLHEVRRDAPTGWLIELTEEEMDTVFDHLQGHFLRTPKDTRRFLNTLARQSPRFEQLKKTALGEGS